MSQAATTEAREGNVAELRTARETSAPPARSRRPSWRAIAVVGVTLALAAGGTAYILLPPSQETTDNAYLAADSAIVAPKVSGLVREVLVDHDQIVHAGDPLVRIDPEEFDARVSGAAANLQSAEAAVKSAQAALVSLDAEEKLAAADVVAAEAAIRSADAQAVRAKADRTRYETLVKTSDVSVADVDQYRAAAISAEADTDKNKAALDVARDQEAITRVKRASLQAALDQARAQVSVAQSTLDLARQDQRHATVLAPVDGVIGDRQVQVGDYVQPGTRLLTVVPMQEVYVVANFKETQEGRMQAAQGAVVKVDMLPGVAFKAKVVSFAPGSGSTFALLPFEPGTGNFTKIVQRVPVRLAFEPGQPMLGKLRPGLSATVSVDLTDR